jgi:hypothetical protein
MKRWLIILSFLIPGFAAMAQNEEPNLQEGKIQERMREYIQHKLNLNRNEAERFTPVFVRYFREFAQTHRQHRGDRLVMQQKIIELRLRYRGEFRQVLDEQRANKFFFMKMSSEKGLLILLGKTAGATGWGQEGQEQSYCVKMNFALRDIDYTLVLIRSRTLEPAFLFKRPDRMLHIMIKKKGPFIFCSLLPPLLP